MSILGIEKAVHAIEANKPDALRLMKEKAPREIQVESLDVKERKSSS